MKNIVVIGSGGVAAEIETYLADINTMSKRPIMRIIGLLDDSIENYKSNAKKYGFSQPWLGTIDSYIYSKSEEYILGFANIEHRSKAINKLIHKELSFATIIHPSAQIAKSAKIGKGNIVYPFCIIGPNSSIGDFNLITSYSFISHDCKVGDNNFLSTSGLSGNVTIGNNNFFGIRATIIPSISIGSNNVIQAGMILDKHIEDGETVFHRFKEKVTIISK